MITGFNTDIQHEGTTYHVQTEDKGLDTPLVLSLVYVGGAILASKRSPYQDLIDTGFDEKKLIERLHRQHKLICAAISAGRIEDLKRMAGRDVTRSAEEASKQIESQPKPTESKLPELNGEEIIIGPASLSYDPYVFAPSTLSPSTPIAEPLTTPSVSETTRYKREESAPALLIEERAVDDSADEELYLHLLDDEGEFRAGQLATIKIHVGRGAGGQLSIADASVTIKVLGTTFRPMILETQTDAEGLAVIRALLPRFTTGRAAIIIRTEVGEDHAELRRIIHHT